MRYISAPLHPPPPFPKPSDIHLCKWWLLGFYRFVEAINFIAPAKSIIVKANSNPWFDNQIMSTIQRWDKLCRSVNILVVKMHSQKMILKKKKLYFEEELAKNMNKLKWLWKALKPLGLSLDKTRKSKIPLRKDDTMQFEALANADMLYS